MERIYIVLLVLWEISLSVNLLAALTERKRMMVISARLVALTSLSLLCFNFYFHLKESSLETAIITSCAMGFLVTF